MAHLVLSRKYRPARFEDLVGQEHVAQTLSNAIVSGRIGHSYLFIGPRGTGKTTTARIFAKALNCEKGPTPTPCGECPSCRDIASGTDLDVTEMDAASNNGVDDVRILRDSVAYQSARSRFRIWIVDEVHMLSLPAFNAFLKTLEEPPPQAKFIFCTTEAHKLPETFVSRCQRLEFRRIDAPAIAARLKELAAREGVEVEDGLAERIASGALGGLRDAESLLEQCLASAKDGRVTLSILDSLSGRASDAALNGLFEALLAGDAGEALDAADRCLDGGAKPDVFLDQCLEAFRGLLAEAARLPARTGGASAGGGGASEASRAARFGLPRVSRSLDLLLEKRRHLREGADGRLVAEVAAVELARLPSARDLDALIEALRADGRGGKPAAQASVPPARPSFSPQPIPPRTSAPPPPPYRPGPSDGASASSAAPLAAVAEAAAGCATGAGVAPAVPATSLADVVARWDLLLAAVERRGRRLHSFLVRAKPVSLSADSLGLALPAKDEMARSAFRQRDLVETFRDAAREVLGPPLRPVVVEGEALAGTQATPYTPSAPDPAALRDDVRQDPAVRSLLDTFNARLVHVERGAEASAAERAGASPAAPSGN